MSNETIQKYYQEEFDSQPYDNEKDYTWKPNIKPFDDEEIFQFMREFDWKSLSEEEKRRNSNISPKLYSFDKNEKRDVVSPNEKMKDLKSARVKIESLEDL